MVGPACGGKRVEYWHRSSWKIFKKKKVLGHIAFLKSVQYFENAQKFALHFKGNKKYETWSWSEFEKTEKTCSTKSNV